MDTQTDIKSVSDLENESSLLIADGLPSNIFMWWKQVTAYLAKRN